MPNQPTPPDETPDRVATTLSTGEIVEMSADEAVEYANDMAKRPRLAYASSTALALGCLMFAGSLLAAADSNHPLRTALCLLGALVNLGFAVALLHNLRGFKNLTDGWTSGDDAGSRQMQDAYDAQGILFSGALLFAIGSNQAVRVAISISEGHTLLDGGNLIRLAAIVLFAVGFAINLKVYRTIRARRAAARTPVPDGPDTGACPGDGTL